MRLQLVTKMFILTAGHDHYLTPVVFTRKLQEMAEIKPGQHLLLKRKWGTKQHLLVETCSNEENKFTAFTEEKGVVVRITVKFPADSEVSEISYEKELCSVVNNDVALQRAEESLKSQRPKPGPTSEQVNTHITSDECGTDVPASHSHAISHGTSPQSMPRHSSQGTKQGFAHDECNYTETTFHGVPIPKGTELPEQCVSQHAETELTSSSKKKNHHKANQRHSSHFVTEMKTGIPRTIDESCLFNHNVAPKSLTLVTPHVALDEGDHVAVETGESQYKHGIVLRNMGSKGLLTIPNLNGDPTNPIGLISLTTSNKFFRVNYEQSVSADQTKKRAWSEQGKQILSEKGAEYFTTWAKTGNALPVNMSQIRQGKMQLRQTRPLYRERITSVDDIKVGDHLIQCYPTHWFHFLVSGKSASDSARINCIYCLRTNVHECEIMLNVQKTDVYRIQYFETFAPEEAIRRARKEVGKRKYKPNARLWFVRWAKTGSDEGIEVDFLENRSMPVSKSQISSFAQLNEGDAIVKKEKLSFAHYYIVTEVCSPYQCVAIESNCGLKRVTLQLKPQNKGEIFYKLNYLPGACFPPEGSVTMATYLAKNYSHKKQLFSKHPEECTTFTSRRFVNYVKTGDSSSINSDGLMNDRPLSIRTVRVFSTRELLPGDHVKCPSPGATNARKLLEGKQDSEAFHHMMVAEMPHEDGACCVFHFAGEKSTRKATISRTSINLFEYGDEVYRICYPERVDPHFSLKFLAKVSNYGKGDDESTHNIHMKNEGSDDGFELQAPSSDFEEYRKVGTLTQFISLLPYIQRTVIIMHNFIIGLINLY